MLQFWQFFYGNLKHQYNSRDQSYFIQLSQTIVLFLLQLPLFYNFSIQILLRLSQYQNCHNMNKNEKLSQLNQIQFQDFNKFFQLSPKRTKRSPNKPNQIKSRPNPFSPTNSNLKKFMPGLKLIRYASDSFLKSEHPQFNKKISEATQDQEKSSLIQYSKNNACHLSFIAERQTKTKRKSNFGQLSTKYIQKSPHMSYFTETRQKYKDKMEKTKELKETSSTSSTDINHKQYLKVPSFLKVKSNLKSSRLSKENISIIKKLGIGKFCSVYLVKDKKTGFLMAMKKFKKSKIIQQKSLEQFIREIKIQSYLNHPNIIKVYGFFDDEINFNVLLELGCHGQLFSFLNKQQKCLSEEATFYVAKQILDACSYMHSRQILHRDIKPQNIVLIHGIVKLCDFGWTVRIEQQLRYTYCGTPLYFSPQLLKGEFYDEKVDVWAVGVLLYEIFTRQSPFQIQQQRDVFKIVTQQYKSFPPCHRQLQEFISAMLEKDPQKRLSSSQLLKFPILQQYALLQTCQQLLS